MGLRPPIVRRARSSATRPQNSPEPARAVRPIPERVAPIRTVDRLVRSEETSTPSPVADAVSQAYQVFDRYLNEGREFAAGQSAWYNSPAPGLPTAQAVPGFAGLPSLPGLPPLNATGIPAGDLLSVAMWFIEQMRQMTPLSPMPAMPSIPGVGSPLTPPVATPATPAPSDWPRPRWPDTPRSERPSTATKPHVSPPPKGPTKPHRGRWVEDRLDDLPSRPSVVQVPPMIREEEPKHTDRERTAMSHHREMRERSRTRPEVTGPFAPPKSKPT